jgi:hypothetical protein
MGLIAMLMTSGFRWKTVFVHKIGLREVPGVTPPEFDKSVGTKPDQSMLAFNQ